jgi:hypothetical protein
MTEIGRKSYGPAVTVGQVKRVLGSLLSREPREVPSVFLWGPPGIGKSSLVKQVAEEKGIEVIDLRLSLLDAVDLRGIPSVKGDKCFWTRPPFLPDEGRGILFLDELNTASPAVQNSALQLVLDRRVGEHKLGDGWYIIAAGNRREDSSLVFQLPDPLLSRFIHFEVKVEVEEWLGWAVKNGIDERIIGFIKFRPELLLKVEPGKRQSISFPCPRAWEFCSRLILSGIDPIMAAESSVGLGAAAEFAGFLEVYSKLPPVEKILSGEVEFPQDLEPSALCALGASLVSHTSEQRDFDRVLEIVMSLRRREFGVYILKLLFAKDKEGVKRSPKWDAIVKRYLEVVI